MECTPFYEPGRAITATADAALTGCRFCAITANRESGPGLSATGEGSNYVVGKPTTKSRVFGVLAFDVAPGGKVTVWTGGYIVPVWTAGQIAAGAEVQINGEGEVLNRTDGIAVGMAMTAAANDTYAEIMIYPSPGGAGVTFAGAQAHVADIVDNTGGATGNDTLEALGQPIKVTLLAGAAAGDHTLAAIAANDTLIAVLQDDQSAAALVDLTSEFTAGAGKINNTSGTNTTGDKLLVIWADKTEADKINNDLADLAAKVNTLIARLEAAQILAAA
jgi:hypothetical protein